MTTISKTSSKAYNLPLALRKSVSLVNLSYTLPTSYKIPVIP